MDFNQIIASLSAFSPLALVLYLVIKEWRSGSGAISKEVITNYATLDTQQKDNIKECRDNLVGATKAMHELELRTNERISNLEGVVSEKDKQLQTLNQIVANRNPELETVLLDIRNFMQNMNQFVVVKAKKAIKKGV